MPPPPPAFSGMRGNPELFLILLKEIIQGHAKYKTKREEEQNLNYTKIVGFFCVILFCPVYLLQQQIIIKTLKPGSAEITLLFDLWKVLNKYFSTDAFIRVEKV